jgi:radical SAM protein with 4Fe4S-binding SPASM domain
MYCPYPYTRLEIKANGDCYCCCEGWLPKSIGNVLEQDLLEIWSGASARQIRESIADQSFRYCTACPYLPGPGGPVVTGAPASPPSTDLIHTLKLDYDQTCQLRCPSCRVTHSREFVNVDQVSRIHDAVIRSGVLARTLKIYVTGAGDPFASPLYWQFLKTLDPREIHPNATIFLHTNGLLFDSDHWVDMGETARDRVAEVGISVDAATERTYKKIRGASFAKLWDNVMFINRLQKEPVVTDRPISLGFFYTVQAANFRELIPFTRMAWNHRASWISVTALRNWGTFTADEYQEMAVHLPHHPDHAEFRRVIEDPELTSNKRIVLDKFNPSYIDQVVICNPSALLPADKLKR